MKTLYAGTVEYLKVQITGDGVDFTAQPVEFSFNRLYWYEAEWIGDPGPVRTAQLLVGDETVPLPSGKSDTDLFIRITNNPEIPVFSAGRLAIR